MGTDEEPYVFGPDAEFLLMLLTPEGAVAKRDAMGNIFTVCWWA